MCWKTQAPRRRLRLQSPALRALHHWRDALQVHRRMVPRLIRLQGLSRPREARLSQARGDQVARGYCVFSELSTPVNIARTHGASTIATKIAPTRKLCIRGTSTPGRLERPCISDLSRIAAAHRLRPSHVGVTRCNQGTCRNPQAPRAAARRSALHDRRDPA
jgi:hypothetical protein